MNKQLLAKQNKQLLAKQRKVARNWNLLLAAIWLPLFVLVIIEKNYPAAIVVLGLWATRFEVYMTKLDVIHWRNSFLELADAVAENIKDRINRKGKTNASKTT